MNPLFRGSLPSPDDDQSNGLDPFAPAQPKARTTDAAADIVRQKLHRLYAAEPDAATELKDAKTHTTHRSRHQEFMYRLSTSGKSLADIQTEWHLYYQGLPDDEKHAVWQEFYDQHEQQRRQSKAPAKLPEDAARDLLSVSTAKPRHAVVGTMTPAEAEDHRSTKAIHNHVKATAGKRAKLQTKHHIQAVLFGLGFGSLALLVTLFGFFNEVVVAPFIQPGRTASATPIIIGANDIAPSGGPKVIIPKINVDIPIDFDAKDTSNTEVEAALDRGVVHYPTTALPGQNGNSAIFGHSSNNLFNKGKYKFAFLQLSKLIAGDTFYLTYDNKVYAYQVIDKKVVPPTDLSVLTDTKDQPATAALITCDPPGTSINRLVVLGKQVNPNPDGNLAAKDPSTQPQATSTEKAADDSDLPGNGPTLWGRFIDWLTP